MRSTLTFSAQNGGVLGRDQRRNTFDDDGTALQEALFFWMPIPIKKHYWLAVALLAFFSNCVQARLVEQQQNVSVQVSDMFNKRVEQTIRVTTFFDDATPQPRPVLVLNHGRAVDAASRASLGRARYSDASAWFAGHGFLVAVPTRVGYGVSGGDDVEDTGQCRNKVYEPAYAAAAQQTQAVLQAVWQRPDVNPQRSVVVGQSFGGATSVTMAARNVAGVVATINFAGGGGGNPQTMPQRPCRPDLLERMFGNYGKTARVPMLWIYTENDQYFGPTYPREWFDAFLKAGGQAEFKQFPPHGEDGHSLFTRFPAVWRPVVADFLRRQGFEIKD